MPSGEIGSLAHAAHPEVSRLSPLEVLEIDAASVVAHAQLQLLVFVPDFHFDVPSLRVPEGVAQRFGGDLIDVIPQNWMKIPRSPLDSYVDDGALGIAIGPGRRELFSKRRDRDRKIGRINGG
jgi:hypothetical protein